MVDSYLLLANSDVSMVDSRDALLAADMVRFGGANQDLLWNAFAKRGLGEGAASNGAGDAEPHAELRLAVRGRGHGDVCAGRRERQPVAGAQLFVGDYQARARAVATPIQAAHSATPCSSCRDVRLLARPPVEDGADGRLSRSRKDLQPR